MIATGIIRRVDDLGRVIIPKEIRRRIGVREGDPLEIFIEMNSTTGKMSIIFQKMESDTEEDAGSGGF